MADQYLHSCPYDANLTQATFFALYDRAQQTVKKGNYCELDKKWPLFQLENHHFQVQFSIISAFLIEHSAEKWPSIVQGSIQALHCLTSREIYERLLVATVAPQALVVAPSIADGGPGNYGFTRTIFPWLQRFLKHTHAQNTLPDVLSWHVRCDLP